MSEEPPATIEFHARPGLLSVAFVVPLLAGWLLPRVWGPHLCVDGAPVTPLRWFGRASVAVSAGPHRIMATWPLSAPTEVVVEADPGERIEILTRMPALRFLRPRIEVRSGRTVVTEAFGVAVGDRIRLVARAGRPEGTISSLHRDEEADSVVAFVELEGRSVTVDLGFEDIEPLT